MCGPKLKLLKLPLPSLLSCWLAPDVQAFAWWGQWRVFLFAMESSFHGCPQPHVALSKISYSYREASRCQGRSFQVFVIASMALPVPLRNACGLPSCAFARVSQKLGNRWGSSETMYFLGSSTKKGNTQDNNRGPSCFTHTPCTDGAQGSLGSPCCCFGSS